MTPLPLWPIAALALAAALWWQGNALHKAQAHAAQLEHAQEVAWIETKNLEAKHRHAVTEQDTQTRAAIAVAQVDADRASAAAGRLRRDLAAYVARNSQPAAVTGQCATNNDATVVLADLFSRADDAAGELAAALDEARVRGRGCETSYDGVAAINKGP